MKTCQEWELAFDLLYDNIASNQAPGHTVFEKSEILTMAQKNVVLMLCNGTLPKSFESTEETTDYLSELVCQKSCDLAESESLPHIVSSSKIYELPSDLLFRTLEICKLSGTDCGSGAADAIVTPVTQDEAWRTMRNPFKKQNKNRVLRLSYSTSTEGEKLQQAQYSELISDYTIDSYIVRYIKNPEPIILADLADGLTIEGKSKAATCKLNEALHNTILQEAVRLAKAIWAA